MSWLHTIYNDYPYAENLALIESLRAEIAKRDTEIARLREALQAVWDEMPEGDEFKTFDDSYGGWHVRLISIQLPTYRRIEDMFGDMNAEYLAALPAPMEDK